MPKLSRMVIHIGMPKTGSTAIQHALAANRPKLLAQDVIFPEAASRGDAHHPLAWAAALRRVSRQGVPDLEEVFTALQNEMEGGHTAILSSEALFHLPPHELEQIRQWAGRIADSIRIVVYVRPPATFHEGWYRQIVRQRGYAATFDEHLEQAPVVSALRRLRTFEQVFGISSLIVRPYLRAQFPKGDVLEDFCSVVSVDARDFETIDERLSNRSLDAELTEFKALLHKKGEQQTPTLEREFVQWSRNRVVADRSLYSPTSWEAFVAQTGAEHEELRARYSLPEDLVDIRPNAFTHEPMGEKRFQTLLSEFRERYKGPAV